MLTVQLMQTQGTGFILDLYPEIIIIYSHSQPHLLETPLFVLYYHIQPQSAPPSRNTSICTLLSYTATVSPTF